MPTYLNTESLRAAITNFRALRELDSSWKMWVENKALQLHMTAPDGWRSQASFYADESLGEQATAFLNAEYERWIVRVGNPARTTELCPVLKKGSPEDMMVSEGLCTSLTPLLSGRDGGSLDADPLHRFAR